MMPPSQWAALPPYQRDAIRIGFIGYTPPLHASRWPETEFGWGIFLGRFANDRRVEELWAPGPAPVSFAERQALAAYEAWKRGKIFSAHSPEKVLTQTGKRRTRKPVKATNPLKALIQWSLGCFAYLTGSEAPAGSV